MNTQVHGTKLWLDLSAWCIGLGGGAAQAWGGPCVTFVLWALMGKDTA